MTRNGSAMTSYAGLDLLLPLTGGVSGPLSVSGGVSGPLSGSGGVSGPLSVSGGHTFGVSSMGVSGSPCRSTASDGDRPELELDMWEGQFSLSSDNIQGGEDGEDKEDIANGGFVNDIVNSTDRWRKDSSVTCTTVQQLQEKVEALTELHSSPDDKYIRLKQENSSLYHRIEALEQDIRERDRRDSRLINAESDKNECDILQEQIEKLKSEKCSAEDQLEEAQHLVRTTQETHRALQETYRSVQEEWESELKQSKAVIEDLTKQLEDLKNAPLENRLDEEEERDVPKDEDLPERISDMEGEISVLRDQNSKRMENNNNNNIEDLEVKILNESLDEGIRIINRSNEKSSSQHIQDMSENEKSVCESEELPKLRKALDDQKEVNDQLRSYIDTVLLNIMDKYPDLLEVRAFK